MDPRPRLSAPGPPCDTPTHRKYAFYGHPRRAARTALQRDWAWSHALARSAAWARCSIVWRAALTCLATKCECSRSGSNGPRQMGQHRPGSERHRPPSPSKRSLGHLRPRTNSTCQYDRIHIPTLLGRPKINPKFFLIKFRPVFHPAASPENTLNNPNPEPIEPGANYGTLTALTPVEPPDHPDPLWRCSCSICGWRRNVARASSLRSGRAYCRRCRRRAKVVQAIPPWRRHPTSTVNKPEQFQEQQSCCNRGEHLQHDP